MQVSGRFGRVVLCVVCAGGAATTFAASPAVAQGREAAIKVRATVRGIAESTLLGAHALSAVPSPTPVDAAPAGAAWRITSGRNASLGIQVDGAAGVTICERSGGSAERCGSHRGLHVESSPDGVPGELVVRLDRQAWSGARAGESVRLTLAFVDF